MALPRTTQSKAIKHTNKTIQDSILSAIKTNGPAYARKLNDLLHDQIGSDYTRSTFDKKIRDQLLELKEQGLLHDKFEENPRAPIPRRMWYLSERVEKTRIKTPEKTEKRTTPNTSKHTSTTTPGIIKIKIKTEEPKHPKPLTKNPHHVR